MDPEPCSRATGFKLGQPKRLFDKESKRIMPEAVGIFWFVGDELVAVACELTNAVPYGDCLTYDGGHAEHWEAWQKAGASSLRASGLPERIATSEYEEYPRGRIVKEPTGSFYMPIDGFRRRTGWRKFESGSACSKHPA